MNILQTELAVSALDVGEWRISERESTSGITIKDKKGRSVARVPLRPDDLDIAKAIEVLPLLIEGLRLIANSPSSEKAHDYCVGMARTLVKRATS